MSSGFPNINREELSEYQVALPAYGEQKSISAIINTHDIRKEEAYLEELKLQKKGLMHELLTGKVRINQVKNNIAISTTA
ncbi:MULTISPECIES: restriction endonuclease subunit S [unclassified Nodularia (in: cyanobacteria)]|uniref:restriction endonuclease subunit S n=1 Tax=unclassified Nodularia (in: cyanobacteria) TaxID=2656917 RepID=UPI00187E9E27|nr:MULTISPECIES: restriction endonuclease subunit S [unclassified Nodularia (in: cyanobacteria)]MBE9200262.1 restriction endonuclease subunit S [Nodularia sp. LEGE 06071]MCC2693405.1 restriction endonuclease subunit S [Nodularia sp. LEGE 04288]